MFEQTFKNIDDVLWKEAGCTTELDYVEQTSWLLFLKYLDDLEKERSVAAELAGRAYTPILDAAHRWSRWAAPKDAAGKLDLNSMIEFKQIIGRGTRLFEGKDYFTIYDFVKAYEHFNDPEWDGEPLEPPAKSEPGEPLPPDDFAVPSDPDEPAPKREMLVVKLADGKERKFQHISATSFWGPDGKPMSAAQFVQSLFGVLPDLFSNEDELRRLWGNPETRKRLLDGLEERGFSRGQLNSIRSVIDAEASDLFDVLAYVAYVRPPETREERVALRRSAILDGLSGPQREFLDFVLSQYVSEGEEELDTDKLPHLLNVRYGSASEGVQKLGGNAREVQEAFRGFQGKLYSEQAKP